MFGDAPLISVVLLCYNHAAFVEEAVDSLLGQTYTPLEIIIIDDCSPDNTAEIIERRLAAHPRRSDVQFIRNPENLSGPVSCIKGIDMTTGKFILHTCGDDIMLPTMVEEMAEVWRKERVSLVTANGYYIDEKSRPLNRTFRDPSVSADDSFDTLARDGGNACCFGPALGFEREVYETFGWPPTYLGCHDIMLPFYAYLLKGARFIPKPLIKYRVHSQNSSLSLAAEKANSLEKALIEERMLIGHLAHATLMEEELDRLANEQPARYAPIAKRIMPLLATQQAEMGKKLARLSRQSGTLATRCRPLSKA